MLSWQNLQPPCNGLALKQGGGNLLLAIGGQGLDTQHSPGRTLQQHWEMMSLTLQEMPWMQSPMSRILVLSVRGLPHRDVLLPSRELLERKEAITKDP